eukprot:TRINITY_DN56919_c0_g1_i1.p1 TRINITY_DN56919_c0_g1~~TRINITY_DN56919_c0_g1_i1.p1  ORF type:complete len:323 (-),score=51.35 TRINITY_DN56919_c0_g1_i1:183-1088(-)
MNGLLVANKACTARVRKRELDAHRNRIRSMKPQIDNSTPETHGLDHLRNNLKREQLLEERYHEIDRDNRILLQKMSDVMKKPSVKSGGGGHRGGPTSLTRDARKQELSRITKENHSILKRIQQASPVYSVVDWENSFRQSFSYLKNSCEYPPAIGRKGLSKSTSSLTPMRRDSRMSGPSGIAPGEAGYTNPADDLRYVLKEGQKMDGIYYLVEMATDGRSLAVTAYDSSTEKTLSLLINEKNHRKLYRDHYGDYGAIAQKLKTDGEILYVDHEGEQIRPPEPTLPVEDDDQPEEGEEQAQE